MEVNPYGSYSSKSAYAAFFEGSIKFGSWRRIWKTWAPPHCKFFVWLVFHNRVWTADRLAKRNLPHPEACPLCDQEDETINHLLVGCVFARQVWSLVLQQLGLLQLAPQPSATRFSGWWKRSTAAVPKDARKGLNSLIILVAWEIWKHQNTCVLIIRDQVFRKSLRLSVQRERFGARRGPPNSKNLLLGRCLLGHRA